MDPPEGANLSLGCTYLPAGVYVSEIQGYDHTESSVG